MINPQILMIQALALDLDLDANMAITLITLMGVVFTGIVALRTNRNAGQANEAVNHRKDGQPSLIHLVEDMHSKVTQISSWKDTYSSGSLDSGDKVEEFVRKVDSIDKKADIAAEKCLENSKQLNRIEADIKRYGCPVKLKEREECLKDK